MLLSGLRSDFFGQPLNVFFGGKRKIGIGLRQRLPMAKSAIRQIFYLLESEIPATQFHLTRRGDRRISFSSPLSPVLRT